MTIGDSSFTSQHENAQIQLESSTPGAYRDSIRVKRTRAVRRDEHLTLGGSKRVSIIPIVKAGTSWSTNRRQKKGYHHLVAHPRQLKLIGRCYSDLSNKSSFFGANLSPISRQAVRELRVPRSLILALLT